MPNETRLSRNARADADELLSYLIILLGNFAPGAPPFAGSKMLRPEPCQDGSRKEHDRGITPRWALFLKSHFAIYSEPFSSLGLFPQTLFPLVEPKWRWFCSYSFMLFERAVVLRCSLRPSMIQWKVVEGRRGGATTKVEDDEWGECRKSAGSFSTTIHNIHRKPRPRVKCEWKNEIVP